ncbi:MAG: Gldg family protein [Planctomycetes bacterium]|nr:Gldg family protein [Planctomycetota bacterium]
MATAADSNTAAAPSSSGLASTALMMLVGLAWGAIMLVVFGLWMSSKYEGRAPIVTNIFLIGGAVVALLAAWQAFTLWFQKSTPAEKDAALEQQRRIFGYVFLAAGIGLIVMAFALGFEKKGGASYTFNKDNFAETFGAILFGLISLGAGYLLQQPPGASISPINVLLGKVPLVKAILIGIGAAALIGFAYLLYHASVGSAAGGITSASNAAPIVVTTSGPTKAKTGDTVTITGVKGNTAANGKHTITVVSPVTFELDNTTGNGEYAGGGAWASAGLKAQSEFVDWFPELLGLLSMSVLCVGCLLWLNSWTFDEFGIRLFVLVFGGATGVILFFMIICRAWLWRQDIFFGGASGWQGPNAWHFWLCAYVLFVSLVLMFVSFNLARADIRTHVALRRVMYGYDAIAQGLLLFCILAILNIVVYYLVPFTFDWTKARGAYSLADSSKALIAGLKQETHVIVILPLSSKAYKDTRSLLDNCLAMADRNVLTVKYLSPDTDQLDWDHMARLFPVIKPDPVIRGAEASGGRGVLLVHGPLPKDEKHLTPHAFVQERKLFDEQPPRQPGEKGKFIYKGEGEILKELKFLSEGRKKRKIYVLQGNDEADMYKSTFEFDRRNDLTQNFAGIPISKIVDRLQSDNYEVVGLTFNARSKDDNPKLEHAKEDADKKKHVPDDCHTLMIPGSGKAIPKEALLAIERFMDRNGRLLVYTDVIAETGYTKLQNSGLEDLLRNWGVEVTNDYLLQVVPQGPVRFVVGSAPQRSENVLARQFVGRSILMQSSARVVRPAQGGAFKAETILQVETRNRLVFPLKDVAVLNKISQHFGELRQNRELEDAAAKEPISVAVAATDKDGKPRVVVFGDTEMITNYDMAASPTQLVNYSMTVSALEWMAGREEIGTRPLERPDFTLDPSVGDQYWRMVLLPGWLINLSVICLGIGIWLVRRR